MAPWDVLEEVAFSTPPGTVSPVVESPLGFHILKVTSREAQSAACGGDEESMGEFRQELYQREMNRHMKVWIEGLRRKAYVDVRLD